MQATLPTVFGEYLLVQAMAGAGTSEVFLAVRLGDRSGRTFTLKRARVGQSRGSAGAQAIAREIDVLGAVSGAGVARMLEHGEIGGLPWIALEHVRGAALDRLRAAGALPPDAVRAVARDIAVGLSTLARAGWVHGDLAPANVVVDDAGEATLIDLGLATRAGDDTMPLAGKAGYIAPERARGAPRAPADVYAWGVTVAELALGRRLFDERDLAEAASRADAAPELPADLADLAPLVHAALARDPAARPTAEAIASSLAPVADRASLVRAVGALGDAPFARVTPAADAAPRATRPRRSQPALVASAALAGAAAMLVVALVARFGLHLGPRRDATLVFQGPVVRASAGVVMLDDSPIPAPGGGHAISLHSGPHVLTLVSARGRRRNVPFEARPGQEVVLFTATLGFPRGDRDSPEPDLPP